LGPTEEIAVEGFVPMDILVLDARHYALAKEMKFAIL
jgi:hypothetical protein